MHPDRFTFLLGLPSLRPGALWRRAQALGAPVLVSANGLSVWSRDTLELRHWERFDGRHLDLVAHHPVALDSAGFVQPASIAAFPGRSTPILTSPRPRRGCGEQRPSGASSPRSPATPRKCSTGFQAPSG